MSSDLQAPHRAVTMYDVAAAAGVSHQSVSRFIRGFTVRPATKERIEKALETLDYRPNMAARTLITGQSQRIGAITHQVNQYGPSTILQGASSAARHAGYLLDIVTLEAGNIDELSDAITLLTQHPLAGIIAFASTDEAQHVFEERSFAYPAVVAAEPDDANDDESYSTAAGVTALVEHLAALGHRRFAHISGPSNWSAARNRSRAYASAVRRLGLADLGVAEGDWSVDSGAEAAHRLMSGEQPTAILAANDQMALGAVSALFSAGFSVPDDVSVTGLDDMPEAAYLRPALTTVRLDFDGQGRDALSRLLARSDFAAVETTVMSMKPAEIVLRGSTAEPRKQ